LIAGFVSTVERLKVSGRQLGTFLLEQHFLAVVDRLCAVCPCFLR